MVSIIVPAHNEALMIRKTLASLLAFDYPQDRYEIVVINDNSNDNSAEILAEIQQEYSGRNLNVIHTDSSNGGKGKSNALNIALEHISGSLISIYDADNTPEPDALRILVETLMADEKLGAVAGMIRTRNKTATLLTRCINIETLSAQCMNQAGRHQYFRLSMLPGTNYVIRRSIVEELGGWDTDALTEDTDLTYRMYRKGYHIRFMPLAVSWEQEPQKLGAWFKQRARWVRGNFYVFAKNFLWLFDPKAGQIRMDVAQYVLMIFVMLSVVTCSNVIAILIWLGFIKLTTPLALFWNWVSAAILFVLTLLLGISRVKKEFSFGNILVSILMIAYSVLWHLVVLYSIYLSIKRRITGQTTKWDKTVRYEEKSEESRENTPV